MEGSIKAILATYKIQNPKLLTELSELMVKSMRGAKQYGKKSVQIPADEEDILYDELITLVKDVCDSEGSMFAVQPLHMFCDKYGLYRKPVMVEEKTCPFIV